MKKNKAKKFLVITYWGLGDFVWASSAISLIKKTFPNSHITLLMLKSFAPLAKNNPVIDEILFYYHNRDDSFLVDRIKKALWFMRYFFKLFFGGFNACIFLDTSILLTLFVKLSRIPIIAGPALRANGYNLTEPSAKFFTNPIPLNPNSTHIHMSQRYQTIARSFLGVQNLAMPVLPDTKYLENKIAALLGKCQGLKVGIAFKGRQSSNALEAERVAGLIKKFNDKKKAAFFLLGEGGLKAEGEKILNLAKAIDAKIPVKNLCGKTDLLDLKQLCQMIDLLICVDTGIMHVAAVTDICIVSLHGHTLPENSRPVSPKGAALCKYISCSPCAYEKCPNNLRCLELISDEEIIETALRLIEEKERNAG
ncbi:MAG: glycosyltransferase family 9 protein [Elusimicrobiota bacterium]|jgi:heptosyltransferase-2|nr:glycosyltransferase family 9 protein [Elusimicrobiota bacterium]